MWFDAFAALAELGTGQKAGTQPLATIATPAQRTALNVAEVASVAMPSTENQDVDHSQYGVSPARNLLTWTGRVVSLDVWATAL